MTKGTEDHTVAMQKDRFRNRRMIAWGTFILWFLVSCRLFGFVDPQSIALYTSLYTTFCGLTGAVLAYYYGVASAENIFAKKDDAFIMQTRTQTNKVSIPEYPPEYEGE